MVHRMVRCDCPPLEISINERQVNKESYHYLYVVSQTTYQANPTPTIGAVRTDVLV